MNRYLGILVIVGIVIGASIMVGDLANAIDAMSFIFVVGIGVGHALSAKSGDNAITRFGDGFVRGGLGLPTAVSNNNRPSRRMTQRLI